jgi:polygalacturonase
VIDSSRINHNLTHLGSVGGRTDNVVNTVTFSSSTIKASANGIRIKTNSGTTGSITGVTYKDIILTGITEYGITVRQDYNGVSGTPTNGVTIKNFVLSNIVGTVTSAGTDIYIVCGSGSCSSWTWSGINVTGGKTSSSCQNLPSGISC